MVPASDNLTVVYPQAGHAVFRGLAERLAQARQEAGRDVALLSASSASALDRGDLAGETVLVVQPGQCSGGLSNKKALFRRLSEARKKVAVCAEPVGSEFFRNQFKVAVDFDAMIDVGFISQADKLEGFELPYRFLFNGPTGGDARALGEIPATERPIPWSLVGHARDDRVWLADGLAQALDPGGLVFLPPRGVVIRKNRGMIGAGGLHKLLLKKLF